MSRVRGIFQQPPGLQPPRGQPTFGFAEMPHTVEIAGDPPVAKVSVDGAVDVTYWRWVLFDSLKSAAIHGVPLVLVDLRTADLHMDPSELVDVGSTVRRQIPPKARVAAVYAPASSAASETPLASSDEPFVHLFVTEDEAREWLGDDAREAAA